MRLQTLPVAYLPEGFAEREVLEIANMTRIVYADSMGGELRLTVMPADESLSIDNDDAEFRQMTIAGIAYYVFASEDGYKPNTVIWYKDGFRFEAFAEMPVDELLDSALSLARQ